jgi:hypothetical protein
LSGTSESSEQEARFPRLKLCAGWITGKVMHDLNFTAADYPHPILPMEIRAHFFRLPFALPWFPTPGPGYSIRRVEFDAWLLKRSGAEVVEQRSSRSFSGRPPSKAQIRAGATNL